MTLTDAAPAAPPAPGPVHRRRRSSRASGLGSVAGITATLVGTQALTSLLGFVYWTLATHRFPVSSVGVASDATSTMQLLGSFGMLGFGTLLISRLPTVRTDRRRVLVRSSLVVVVGASTLLGLAFAAAVGLSSSGGLRAVAASPADALLFAVGVALTGGTLVIDQAVLSAGSGLVQLERNVVASVTKIGFLVALSVAGAHGGMAIYLSWVLGIVASLPVVLYRTRRWDVRIERPRWIDRSALRGSWRDAGTHHILNLALQAPLMLFPAIITVEASAQSTGYFATVLLLAGFVFVLPYALSVGLFASGINDAGSVRERMRTTLPFGIAASLCADVVLIPLAPLVLRVFGAGYATHGTVALRLVVLAGLPFVLKDHYVALRRVEERAARAARLILVTSVLEVVAAVVGAQQGGTTGLCLAWLATVYVEAVVFGAVLWRELPPAAGRLSSSAAPLVALLGRATALTGSRAAPPAALPPHVSIRAVPLARPVGPTAAPAAPASWGRAHVAGASVTAMSLGVAVEGLASVAGNERATPAAVDALYWAGLLLIFTPAIARILSPRTTRVARAGFVLALGVLLQLSRFALFPTQFVFHDELAHANTLRLLQSGHRLFTANPLLPVSPYYPGLEVCTEAIHSLLGLSDRQSAAAVLVACRVVMTLAIYLGVERVAGSSRWAAIASVVYVCNEQYLFFNSQYSYQSLALPLALLTVWAVLRSSARPPVRARSLVLPIAGVAGTVVSHHLTAMLLTAALCAWAVAERAARGRSALGRVLSTVAPASVILVLGWTFVPGNPVWSYLDEIARSGYDALAAFVEGRQSHVLFSGAGYRAPTWEIAASVASELLVVGALGAALVQFWRHRTWRLASLSLLLGLAALAFPAVPAGHLTAATSEITDRASGFLFVGVGFVVGGWWWGRRRWREGGRVWRGVALALLVLAFVGQTILGSGPQWAQTPGSFLVSADSRSIDAANLAAAHWESTHLPAGTRVLADRDGSLLAGAIGGLYPVSHIADGTNGSPILLSPTWTAEDLQLLRTLRIVDVVVDRRDATGLPREGVYYESGEYDQARTAPVPIGALTKFATLAGARAIYDDGAIQIYDLSALSGAR